jgi:serine/threonine protein kinase
MPAVSADTSWELGEGDEIAPGRTVLKPLGGGNRYEVLLVWDDVRFAIMVAKVLRPAVAREPGALQDLEEEAEALRALSHPVILRGFDAVLEGDHPQYSSSTSRARPCAGCSGPRAGSRSSSSSRSACTWRRGSRTWRRSAGCISTSSRTT